MTLSFRLRSLICYQIVQCFDSTWLAGQQNMLNFTYVGGLHALSKRFLSISLSLSRVFHTIYHVTSHFILGDNNILRRIRFVFFVLRHFAILFFTWGSRRSLAVNIPLLLTRLTLCVSIRTASYFQIPIRRGIWESSEKRSKIGPSGCQRRIYTQSF